MHYKCLYNFTEVLHICNGESKGSKRLGKLTIQILMFSIICFAEST